MQNFVQELISDFENINFKFQSLLEELEGKEVPSVILQYIDAYNSNIEHYHKLNRENTSESDERSIISLIHNLLSFISSITSELSRSEYLNETFKKDCSKIANESNEKKQQIKNRPVKLGKLKNSGQAVEEEFHAASTPEKEKFYKTKADLDAQKKHFASLLNRLEKRLAQTEEKGETLYEKVENEINKINTLYDDVTDELASKRQESSILLEAISRDTFSGNYEERASREEEIADKLRSWSLISMAISIAIIIATVIEASLHTYSLPNAILRFGLIFAVTIPSAYLARESNKHREKHNSYLEKSLDLKALSPFIASLEKEDQDEIKTKMADRLFANNPNNTHHASELPTTSVDAALNLLEKAKDLAKELKKES